MRAYDIIVGKRDGHALGPDEIEFMVSGYARGEIPEYQMSAWLMAVFFQGMTRQETSDLTMAVVNSGDVLDLSGIPGIKVDKHSTGGVGDKTTLVLAPVMAAAGIPVVKMSGRSLGYTGGTLDKLESIPGFSVSLTPEQMLRQVERIGIALAGQTAELAPADKKMYNLRDLTGTVDSIPLIAASVMSKKIAAGADALLLDVKTGSGAFMKSMDLALELAHAMVSIGRSAGRRTAALITDMDQPLGRAVGNSLEVVEAVETLTGRGPDDLTELCLTLGGIALVLGGKSATEAEGRRNVQRIISSGEGLEKLREVVKAQGGDVRVIDDTGLLPVSPIVSRRVADQRGWICRLDAMEVALAASALGAGRGEAGVSPDLAAGVLLRKKSGDYVEVGDVLAEIHTTREETIEVAVGHLDRAYEIGSSASPHRIVELARIGPDDPIA